MKKKTAPTAPNGKGVMFNMRVQRWLLRGRLGCNTDMHSLCK